MSWLSSGLKKVEKFVAKIPHTTQAEKRASIGAAQEQISYYQQEKADMVAQRTSNEEQKKNERSRINEKEIRSRQRTQRRGGFMAEPSSQPTGTLG